MADTADASRMQTEKLSGKIVWNYLSTSINF